MEVNAGACGDGGTQRGVDTISVTYDIRGLVFGAVFEAKVCGSRGPAYALGRVAHIWVFVNYVAGVAVEQISKCPVDNKECQAKPTHFCPLATMLET